MAKTRKARADGAGRPFALIHIGHLHLTDLPNGAQAALVERQTTVRADLNAILGQLGSITPADAFDFVYLPGDSEVKATDDREDGKDFVDIDTIEPAATAAQFEPRRPGRLGSDAFALGSWPQKGIRGDQLGPNKRGRKW